MFFRNEAQDELLCSNQIEQWKWNSIVCLRTWIGAKVILNLWVMTPWGGVTSQTDIHPAYHIFTLQLVTVAKLSL